MDAEVSRKYEELRRYTPQMQSWVGLLSSPFEATQAL
jgi:hypothetical protein